MSQSDRYIPEHDYKKTNYKPLGRPFTKDMCGSCKSYYKGLFNAGITKKEFPIECSGHILDQVKQLNREDFDSDEDFDLAKIFSDPVAWAKFEFGWDHRWYQEFVSSCLPASEMVFMDDGTLKSIKDIKIGDKVVTYDNKGCRTFSNKVTKFFDNGVKPVYKISLENGDTLKCTRDHKILAHTKSGRTNSLFDCKSLQVDYISLDDGLKIGDRVYSINSFDKFGNVNNTDLAKWLGYIASDSYVKKCKLVQFVNTNKKYVDEFIELTNKLFPNDPLQVDFRASSFDSETGIERKDSWLCSIYKKDSKALRFLESIGVEGPETRELKSFEFAFKFSKESLGAFLNRLYSGDGCISTSINKERGIYTSRLSLHGGNEEPLKLMRLLLKKVGVNSSHINFKKDSNSVGLFISAGLDIIRFLDFTGLIFGKEENSLLAYNTSLGKRANRRRFSRASRTKITSIEYAGVERVYDIEVSSRHNFIAGGTVVHNCTARKKVLRGGRRSGKSRVEIVLILHEMVTLPNRKILLLAPSEKLIGEFFDVISEFIKMSSTLKDSIERSTKNPHLLQLKNGSKLLGISISPKDPDAGDKARGFDANLFIIDESEMFKEKDMEAIMALLVSSPDTRVMISSTPKGWRKHFYRICTNKNLAYKEFWWISGEKPDWTTEMEAQLKEEYTEAGYTSEFNADFGELEEGTFKKKYIDPSLRNYDCTFNGPERGRTYVLGVDWNKSAGNHMVICEIEGGMITMRKKIITPESEFMHTKAVEDITLLHRMWNFKYIFVDAGYGHTNVELLKKWGLENPASGMLKALHAVYMNEDIEVKDPINGEAVRRRAKPYIVEQTVKLLEDGCLILPSSEDYGHVGEGLSDIGLVEQMRNFRIERYSVYNLPTYSQGQDHTLTAYMLCCAMWVNKEGPLKDPRYSNKVWNIPTATTQEIPLTPTEKEMLKTMEKNKFIRSSGHIDPRNKKYHKKKENISRSNLGPPGRGRSFNWTNRNTF